MGMGNEAKRRRKSSSWSQLPSDLLESILNRCNTVDVIRSKAVCRWWKCGAQALSPRKIPWFMLGSDSSQSLSLFDLEEEKSYTFKDAMPMDCACVGYSQGWLVVLDKRKSPRMYLLNLFSSSKKQRIQLPDLKSYPVQVQTDGTITVTRPKVRKVLGRSVKGIGEFVIRKAVLSSDPSDNCNYSVAVIYGNKSRLAFTNSSGDKTWTDLPSQQFPEYLDITFSSNKLYALSSNFVEVWGLNHDNNTMSPLKFLNTGGCSPYLFSKTYLVESAGDVLLVDYNPADGFGRSRRDLKWHFYVVKLDFNLDEAEAEPDMLPMESLNDRVLFIGGNHSMALSAPHVSKFKRNSIYFINDVDDSYLDSMKKYYFDGLLDVCVYNFEMKTVDIIYQHQCNSRQIGKYSPFWILPVPS